MNRRDDSLAAVADGKAAAALPQVGVDRAHESAHLHVAGEATYVDDIRELAGHAACRTRPVAGGAWPAAGRGRGAAARASPAWWRAGGRRHPRHERLRPIVKGDDPILARAACATWASRCSPWWPTPARGAPRGGAGEGVPQAEPLPALLTPREAHAAQQYVVPPMHLARGDAAAALAPRRTAARQPERRRAGAVLPGRPDQLCGAAGRRHAAAALFHPAPSEMQHLVAHALGATPHAGAGGVPAHGRRLWRQGIAVGAAGLRGGAGGARLRRPVKLRLDRDDDFMVTGRRHGFEFDFDVGYDDAGRVLGARST
jgi:xanthine dehydrogenase large subunit